MNCHNRTNKARDWRKVKAKIIERFGTVTGLAAVLQCHPNSVRLAAEGRCPKVKIRLEEALQ